VDSRSFVESLMKAVPEAFSEPDVEDYYLNEPLPYVALGDTRIWLENTALDISTCPMRAKVRPEHSDAFRRFWTFIEDQAHRGNGDKRLETLLQIECFEGVGWVDDVLEYLGPQTRRLLLDAQRWLASYNDQVGRWAPEGARRKRRG
jgi:hypothetical protein